MVLGRADWDAFDEKHFQEEALVAIMKKVQVVIDPEVESQYPRQRGAIVEIHFGDGKVLSARVNHPLGEPENPLPSSITLEKFRNTAGTLLSRKTRERIETLLDISGRTESAKKLFDTLGETVQGQ
jgi:2-methylcitrate dehydratase